MRDRSYNTGRKKPRKNDYKDSMAAEMPEHAPYRFTMNIVYVVVNINSVLVEEEPQTIKEAEKDTEPKDSRQDEPKQKANNGKHGGNRCDDCDGCRRKEDCKECIYCKDKKGNGGPGVLRQCCKLK